MVTWASGLTVTGAAATVDNQCEDVKFQRKTREVQINENKADLELNLVWCSGTDIGCVRDTKRSAEGVLGLDKLLFQPFLALSFHFSGLIYLQFWGGDPYTHDECGVNCVCMGAKERYCV